MPRFFLLLVILGIDTLAWSMPTYVVDWIPGDAWCEPRWLSRYIDISRM
jgi:hypothetical protein